METTRTIAVRGGKGGMQSATSAFCVAQEGQSHIQVVNKTYGNVSRGGCPERPDLCTRTGVSYLYGDKDNLGGDVTKTVAPNLRVTKDTNQALKPSKECAHPSRPFE
jgi:hypothetical protein